MQNQQDLTDKQRLQDLRSQAIAEFQRLPNAQRLLHALSKATDTVICDMWTSCGIDASHTLVAVGGYGRGELFPHSDIDLLILLSHPEDVALRSKIETFVQRLWTLGLTIGHSVRTLDECLAASAADITVQTALLEARFLSGNRALFKTMQNRYDEQMDPQAFFIAKTLETRQRHVKMGDTPYSLEPNCKESPGGLRDLQVILWLAKATRLGNSWKELASHGLLTVSEAKLLRKRERAFKDIRIRLHLQAKRAEDRLLFDLQLALGETFGFKKNGQLLDRRSASEMMMQRYYRAAHTVSQLNNILLLNIESYLFPKPTTPISINANFCEVNGLIDITKLRTFLDRPSAILEAFCLLAQRSDLKGMTARTLRAMWHARIHIDQAYRTSATNNAYFLRIFKSPCFDAKILKQMNESGVLGRYLPNFEQIIGQLQHDLFHQFTVDQHIMAVIDNLHRFSLAEYAHENPLCSHLMTSFDKPWLLYIAGLFHDIAKGRGGDHSKLGMVDAREFCIQHRISADDTDLIVFLVGEHLTLSQVAQKKDLSDPEVIRQFASVVKNERYLTALYLLTVADIRGTNTNIWNAWRSKLLEDLFRMTLRVLGGEEISTDHELRRKQKEAIATLRLYGLPEQAHEDFWKQLDIVYFLRHDASDIAWQTRTLYGRIHSEDPVVKCRLSPVGEGLQVTVYMHDREDLFARICSYFERKNFSIFDAKIHTTSQNYALDTFFVTRQGFEKNYRDIISLVEHELTQLLKSQDPLPAPTSMRLSRISRSFPITPTVDLRPDAEGKNFVLSIVSNDRTGLLYAIARLFNQYQVNLHTAKIMTLGERIEDVFLIDSAPLQIPKTQIQFETDLIALLKID